MTTEPTCAERLPAHLASRLDTFHALTTLAQVYGDEATPEIVALAKDQDIDEEYCDQIAGTAQERIYELPLSVQKLTVYRVDLSTGGPGDWLEAFVDSDGEITRITYHFNDWFDHAEKTLERAEFERAEAFVRTFTDGGE